MTTHALEREAARSREESLGIQLCGLCGLCVPVSVTAQPRPRARDLGIVVGIYPSGARNAITDVDGVRVGHTTIIDGDRVRTGVTAIVPHGGNVFPGQGRRRGLRRQCVRQAGRIDTGQRAGHD
jgi:hypothetical protein